jgi:hypothetical protein
MKIVIIQKAGEHEKNKDFRFLISKKDKYMHIHICIYMNITILY